MEKSNEVILEGTVLDFPEKSHENHGTAFYRFVLGVNRLSGQRDDLPVVVTEGQQHGIRPGERLRLRGELRSFNNRTGVGSRLVLTVFVRELLVPEGEEVNSICLEGLLCKAPIYRRTPLGRSICDMILAVPRHYGRADYLPVIAWGNLAVRCREMDVGDSLSLIGRVQSREYQKVTEQGTESRIAYEVSVMELR